MLTIVQRNSRSLYVLKFYYKSIFTNIESFIKFEISFVECLINKPLNSKIKNIIDYYNIDEIDLKIMNYDLNNLIIDTYSIKEIILEKLRASITRIEFKPRDIFDLFLINKLENIFEFDLNSLFKKLDSSPFDFQKTIENIQNFINSEIEIDLDDINNLSLIDFDETEFMKFCKDIMFFLKDISKKYLEQI